MDAVLGWFYRRTLLKIEEKRGHRGTERNYSRRRDIIFISVRNPSALQPAIYPVHEGVDLFANGRPRRQIAADRLASPSGLFEAPLAHLQLI